MSDLAKNSAFLVGKAQEQVRRNVNPYIVSTVICLAIVFTVPLSITFSRPDTEPWSHRCYSEIYGDNTIEGCIDALQNGFLGIESDFHMANGSLYMKHDAEQESNQTLRELFTALDGFPYEIYIDMKTEEPEENFAFVLLDLLLEFKMLQKSWVGVYDDDLINTLRRFGIKTVLRGRTRGVNGQSTAVAQWWAGTPWYSVTLAHTFVFTANSPCQYAELTWGRPSVVFVDFTSPHVRDCDAGTGVGIVSYVLWSLFAVVFFTTCTLCTTHRLVRLQRLTRKRLRRPSPSEEDPEDPEDYAEERSSSVIMSTADAVQNEVATGASDAGCTAELTAYGLPGATSDADVVDAAPCPEASVDDVTGGYIAVGAAHAHDGTNTHSDDVTTTHSDDVIATTRIDDVTTTHSDDVITTEVNPDAFDANCAAPSGDDSIESQETDPRSTTGAAADETGVAIEETE